MPQLPFAVRALYEYAAEQEDDLPFLPGQRLTVDEVLDEDWYHGHYIDSATEQYMEGIFPINYVEIDTPPSRPQRRNPVVKHDTRIAESPADANVTSEELSKSSKEPVKDPVEQTSKEIPLSSTNKSNKDPASSQSSPIPKPSFARQSSGIDDDDWGDDYDEDLGQEKEIKLGAPKTTVPPEVTAKVAAGSESSDEPVTERHSLGEDQVIPTAKSTSISPKSQAMTVTEQARDISNSNEDRPTLSTQTQSQKHANANATATAELAETKSTHSQPISQSQQDSPNVAPVKRGFSPIEGEESESEPMTSIAYEVHAANHKESTNHSLTREIDDNLQNQKTIDAHAYAKIDDSPKVTRPFHEEPMVVDEPSESEHTGVTHGVTSPSSEPITDQEPDFKTRLARFNQGISTQMEPELKRPERKATFGKSLNFNLDAEQDEVKKPYRENTEEYKPSMSLKERIAMLQKSQDEEKAAADADAASEERRKLKRAQLAAEAEANRIARREAEEKEAEQRRVEEAERKMKLAQEKAEQTVKEDEKMSNSEDSSESITISSIPRIPEQKDHGVSGPPSTSQHQHQGHYHPTPNVESLNIQDKTHDTSHQNEEKSPPPIPNPKDHEKSSEANTGQEKTMVDVPNQSEEEISDIFKGHSNNSISENTGHDKQDSQERYEGADDDDDDADARRIALRERMARLANSMGGVNLGMIMGGGMAAPPGASGGPPKRERRISRSEYEAMSAAEIEAAEARREAEESAPVSIFGEGPAPPKAGGPHSEPDAISESNEDYYNAKPTEDTSPQQRRASSTSSDLLNHNREFNEQGHVVPPESPRSLSRVSTNQSDVLKSPQSDKLYDAPENNFYEDKKSEVNRVPSVLTPPGPPGPPITSASNSNAKAPATPSVPATSAIATSAPPVVPTPSIPPAPPAVPTPPAHTAPPAVPSPSAPPAVPAPSATSAPPAPPAPLSREIDSSFDDFEFEDSHNHTREEEPAQKKMAYPQQVYVPPTPTSKMGGESTMAAAPQFTSPHNEVSGHHRPPPQPPVTTAAANVSSPNHAGPRTAIPPPPHAPPPPLGDQAAIPTPTRPVQTPPVTSPPPPTPGARPPPPVPTHSNTAQNPSHPPPPPPPQQPAPPQPGARLTSTESPQHGFVPPTPPAHQPASVSRSPTFGSAPPRPPLAKPVNDDERSESIDSFTVTSSPTVRRSSTLSSPAIQSWLKTSQGIPEGLVAKGETYKVTDAGNERQVLVVHKDWSQTTFVFSLQNGELLAQDQLPPPVPEPAKLKETNVRLGPSIVSAAQHDAFQADGTERWITRILESTGALLVDKKYGIEIYTNIGNASIQQIEEIRPGDICVCEDASFQGSRGPLQKYHKTFKDNVFIISEWDGTKRKLHFFDNKKETLRLGDLRMGVVRIFRAVDYSYLAQQ